MEATEINQAKNFPRRIILGPRLSNIFRFCFLIIAINILVALLLCLYFFQRFWKQNKEPIFVNFRDAELQLRIPALIKSDEKLHFESTFEDYLQASNLATLQQYDDLPANDSISDSLERKELQKFAPLFVQTNAERKNNKCYNKEHKTQILQHGNYWVLKNFYRAEHGAIDCYSSVTFATHGEYTQLGNIEEILRRWDGPISLALYAPESDFATTLKALRYLLNCLPESPVIRLFLSVHIYFDTEHISQSIWKYRSYIQKYPEKTTCPKFPPYQNLTEQNSYRSLVGLLYPINIGRNIARDAALTHFILDADLDMYPSMGLNKQFLRMISENGETTFPSVFALPVFGAGLETDLPKTKTELRGQLQEGKSHLLNDDTCYKCNILSNLSIWISSNQVDKLSIFSTMKRLGPQKHWEPHFIGTNDETFYHERFSREGRKDRTSQAYLLCALEYDIHLLNSGFLIRKITTPTVNNTFFNNSLINQTENYLIRVLHPNMKKIFGIHKGCSIMKKY